MADIDTARLRALAEAATPGPWVAGETTDWDGTPQASVDSSDAPITWDDHGGEVFKPEDAAYITAIDPPTLIALLDRLEELEGREPEWEYGYARIDTEGHPQGLIVSDEAHEVWKRGMSRVRRRKTGEWEPVTGDDDE